MRTEKDRALDAVWLLYALNKAHASGRTKMQKSMFLVELKLQEQELPTPHFRFFRYNNGPFSRQIWDDFDELASKGFVHKSSFEPTERGMFLLDFAVSEFKVINRMANALEAADEVLEFCKPRSGLALMNYVYGLEVVPAEIAYSGEKMKVEDIPMFWDILDPPSDGADVAPDLIQMLGQYFSVSDEDVRSEMERLPQTTDEAIQKLSSALAEDPLT